MLRVSAKTLEEAYTKAAKELNASIVDLDIEVLQNPSSGFLGLFTKDAIIKASLKEDELVVPKNQIDRGSPDSKIKHQIKEGLNRLLDASCFDISLVELRVDRDEGVVYIKLDGDDVALLIGKEGYRYKALSYALHNWIKIKYDLSISLEISEFLKNQEEMVRGYLESVKERVDEYGKAQTKPLDGILVKIALNILRESYPDKYVAIRRVKNGKKIVVVSEFRGKSS